MKRALSILLALIIALSAFSMAAFAEEAPQTKTAALVEKVCNATEFCLSFSTEEESGNGLSAPDSTLYVKGSDFVLDTKMRSIPIRATKLGNTIYMCISILPFLYVSFKSDFSDIGEETKDMWTKVKDDILEIGETFSLSKSYEDKIGSETCFVEEFSDNADITAKFYYLGEELKLVTIQNAAKGTNQIVKVNSYSFEVNERLFKKPIGIDITKLLGFINPPFTTM